MNTFIALGKMTIGGIACMAGALKLWEQSTHLYAAAEYVPPHWDKETLFFLVAFCILVSGASLLMDGIRERGRSEESGESTVGSEM
jgi:hypothetical protein